MDSKYQKAVVKFNNGRGACLCNRCNIILSYGTDHHDTERYCGDCYQELVDALFNIAKMRPHKESVQEIKRIARSALDKDRREDSF